MRALIVLLVLLASCSGKAPVTTPTTLAPCLDRPEGAVVPPNGQLPCELLPPRS